MRLILRIDDRRIELSYAFNQRFAVVQTTAQLRAPQKQQQPQQQADRQVIIEMCYTVFTRSLGTVSRCSVYRVLALSCGRAMITTAAIAAAI
jgi:hypothetical protein